MNNTRRNITSSITKLLVNTYMTGSVLLAKAQEIRKEQKAKGVMNFYFKIISIEAASYLVLQHFLGFQF